MNGERPITRIDVTHLPNCRGVMVEKYEAGWTAGTRAAECKTVIEMTFDEIVEWLETNRWVVYRWPACPELSVEQGARAFKPKPQPVRSKSQMIWLRSMYGERAERALRQRYDPYTGQYKPLAINLSLVDLAYCL